MLRALKITYGFVHVIEIFLNDLTSLLVNRHSTSFIRLQSVASVTYYRDKIIFYKFSNAYLQFSRLVTTDKTDMKYGEFTILFSYFIITKLLLFLCRYPLNF